MHAVVAALGIYAQGDDDAGKMRGGGCALTLEAPRKKCI